MLFLKRIYEVASPFEFRGTGAATLPARRVLAGVGTGDKSDNRALSERVLSALHRKDTYRLC